MAVDANQVVESATRRHLRACRVAATFAFRVALLALLLSIAVGSSGSLLPQQIRVPTVERYDPYLDDFVVFYAAAVMVSRGDGQQLYVLDAARRTQAQELGIDPARTLVLPFFNPPPVALTLVPLSALPLHLAAWSWTVVGVGVFIVSLITLLWPARRAFDLVSGAILGLAVVTSFPFREVILHGQMTFFVFGAFTVYWFGLFRRPESRTGVLAFLLLSAKPQLLPVVTAEVVLSRRWRLLIVLGAGLLALGAISTAVIGPSVFPDYLRLLFDAARWEEENGISTYGMFGWNAFARALLGSGHHAFRALLTAGLTLTTVGAAAALAHRFRRTAPAEAFAAVVFGTLLASPHLYAHDVLLAGAAMAVLWAQASSRAARAAWVTYAALGWLTLRAHFDLLDLTGINFGTLWLALGFVMVLLASKRENAGRTDNDAAVARDTAVFDAAQPGHGVRTRYPRGPARLFLRRPARADP